MQDGEYIRLGAADIDIRDASNDSGNEQLLESVANKGTGLDSESHKTASESLLDELIDDAVWDVCVEVMDSESLFDELLVHAIWDVCFEVHHVSKIGYIDLTYPEEAQVIVQEAEKDIHGKALKCKAQYFQIPCPICKYKSCATKFAFHLAKCIRISERQGSRAASQRIAENKHDDDDDDSDPCMNSNRKRTKKNSGKKNARRKPKTQERKL